MPKDRSGSILEEIEKRKAVPIPRWRFLLKQAGFWLLAAISVVTGSISMATAIYVFIDNDFIEDHDYIHLFFSERPFIADIFAAIPYLWVAALLLFTLVAFFGFRHTRKGYRYATTKVIAASLLASLVFSLCLNTIDVGGYIHRHLIENVHAYNNLINSNEHRWTHSEKGFLGGRVMQNDKQKHLLVVRDFSRVLWSVDISAAEVKPGTNIVPGKYLKMTGIKTGNRSFKAFLIQGWEKRYRKRVPPVPKPVIIKPVPDSLAH
ncbi:MAG: hypothetical protein WCK85_04345 [Chlorobium sp.]